MIKALEMLGIRSLLNSVQQESVGETHKHPSMYTNPPTWESAPEGPNLLVGSGEVTESQSRAEEVALFLPKNPHHTVPQHSMWVAPPWQIPRAPPLTR